MPILFLKVSKKKLHCHFKDMVSRIKGRLPLSGLTTIYLLIKLDIRPLLKYKYYYEIFSIKMIVFDLTSTQ